MFKSPGAVPYLNGTRGVAAFLVFLHHFLLSFYPAHYTYDPGMSHLNGFDILFGRSVFSVFVNGNFCVCIFFVLSGFVLSRSYYHHRDVTIPVAALYKRFLRLYVPVAVTLVLSAILVQCEVFYNTPAAIHTHSEWWLGGMWHIDHPGALLLRSLAYDVMFNGSNILDTSMWTISFELYGSLLVFVFLIISHFARYRTLVILALLYYFYFTQAYVYLAFMLGVTLCDMEKYGRLANRYKTCGSIIMITIALVLGSFPSNGAMEGTLFASLGHTLLEYKFWFHTVGAYFLILAFVLAPYLQSIAGKPVFLYLGHISFSLYLLHPLILGSFSSWLFLQLIPFMSYHISVVTVLVATVFVMLPVSWLMTRYIDEAGIMLARLFACRIMIALPTEGNIIPLKALSSSARHREDLSPDIPGNSGSGSGKDNITQ